MAVGMGPSQARKEDELVERQVTKEDRSEHQPDDIQGREATLAQGRTAMKLQGSEPGVMGQGRKELVQPGGSIGGWPRGAGESCECHDPTSPRPLFVRLPCGRSLSERHWVKTRGSRRFPTTSPSSDKPAQRAGYLSPIRACPSSGRLLSRARRALLCGCLGFQPGAAPPPGPGAQGGCSRFLVRCRLNGHAPPAPSPTSRRGGGEVRPPLFRSPPSSRSPLREVGEGPGVRLSQRPPAVVLTPFSPPSRRRQGGDGGGLDRRVTST